MTEYERVKKAIIEILRTIPSGWADTDHGDDCKMLPCPECIADAILAIPGLFVEDNGEDEDANPWEIYHEDSQGRVRSCCIGTMINARAQGWKKAEGK